MAHPKRKISKTRRDKRRTHDKTKPLHLAVCPITGIHHPYHQAFWKEDKLYYKGRILFQKQLA